MIGDAMVTYNYLYKNKAPCPSERGAC
jgi:hypothetical protein